MKDEDCIAKSSLYASRGGSDRQPIELRVGRPLSSEGYPSVCVVEVFPLEKEYQIRGEDSLQALCLALGFLRKRTAAYIDKGWTFYLEAEGETCDPLSSLV